MKLSCFWTLVAICLLTGLAATAAEKPVTIDFWHAMSSGHQPNLQKMATDFMAEYPYITVNLVYQGSYSSLQGKINAAVAAGNLPTMAQLYESWATPIASMLYPIGPHLTQAEAADIVDGLVPSNTYNGVLTTVPFVKSVMVLYYNADLIPTPPTTWAEYFLFAKSLTADLNGDGTIDRYGTAFRPLAQPEQLLVYLNQAGGSILSANWSTVTINNAAGVAAIQFLAGLVPYSFITTDYMSDHMAQVAMFIDTSAGYSYNKTAATNAGYNLGVDMLPAGPANQSSMIQGTNLAVFDVPNQTQAQKDAAVLLTRFLLRAENAVFWAMKSGYQPVTKSAYGLQTWKDYIAANPFQQAMSAQMLLGFSQILHPNYADMRSIISIRFDEIMRGAVAPLDGLNSMAEEIAPLVGIINYLSLPPVAQFTWQALSSSGARLLVEPRTGDRIQFDASGSSDPDGRIVSYEWDWESNGSYDTNVTSPTIEHTSSTSGAQRVSLRVTDDQGATGSVTQTVDVGERQAPQALFTFSPSQPSVLDSVRFSDTSSDADGQVVSWKWEFGDGTTSADRNPTHTYSRKGTFTVKLTVTDSNGLTGTKSQTLSVVNLPPDASFTCEPQTSVVGQSVRFDGSASTDRDGTISSYAWDFNGDGKTESTGMEAAWTFLEAETYTVTLSVVDSDGATGTATKDVTVSAAPSGPPRFAQQWGLVIGVGNYEDPAILDLNYTEADAQAFYDFLTSPQGGGYQKDHVRFLLNEQATTAAVKAAFRWLISQAGADDLVVIYFAGHGGTGEDVTVPPDEADGVDEYVITYDAQKTDLFSTAVRDDEMADWLASFRCDNVVVILDSCFAAGATRSLEQTGTRAGSGNRVFNDLVGPGRLFLAASQEDEFSYEDPALGHGVFTYYLLRGLGAMEGVTTPEADADQDGRVTVEELRTYLEREVTRAKPQQHPLATGDLALTRVALDGYGEPLVGEVTAIQGDYVIVSLGSRHGIQVGDRFEVVRLYTLPDGSTAAEVRALIQIASILGPDRAACVLIESHFSVEIGDSVRPAQ